MIMSEGYVLGFDEADFTQRELLGNKGANLAKMIQEDIPVPPGFILTTKVCKLTSESRSDKIPKDVWDEVRTQIQRVEEWTGFRFGDPKAPLLFSVRSGAPVSMPGMMDTVLNLGLNDQTVKGLDEKSGNPRFAYDCYRRFIQMFSSVVLGMEHSAFETCLEKYRLKDGVDQDCELPPGTLRSLVQEYKGLVLKKTGDPFPEEPLDQLKAGILAVFDSWNTARAKTYRRIHSIPDSLGTAVNVQAMVFGNLGDDSGTGVLFSRHPSTGENQMFGEYLQNAQGEDVVAGIRTPVDIAVLNEIHPALFQQLRAVSKRLEKSARDMQDIEFTIQEEVLFILQTRVGKRTAQAALKIAVDMVEEGLITQKTAVLRVEPDQIDQLMHKQVDPEKKVQAQLLARGLPASPGAAVGKVVLTPKKACELAASGVSVILVRQETSPEDIEGLHASLGVLTARGGMTSHAAVVARGMGKCCVAGCSDIKVLTDEGHFCVGDLTVQEGAWVTLDGSTGEVFLGRVPVKPPKLDQNFQRFMSWSDQYRKLKVMTNADTPTDALVAKNLGAEGIGLCRTEHMFFEPQRLRWVREMILSSSEDERAKALSQILPMQKEDFKGLFRVMDSLPVIVRLLDPPLHEFLPTDDVNLQSLSQELEVEYKILQAKVDELKEANPMLGYRGCRLGLTHPEINAMQARAIFEAALDCLEEGITALPYIEVPLVGDVKEFSLIRKIIEDVACELQVESKIDYRIGTMIEVPRAALTADKIAKVAEFMSFGTNDLTQMDLGFSRDDAGKFLPVYVEKGIYERDPFQSIDKEGVGELMRICVGKARSVNPNLQIGICGEHGGDPESVFFCHEIGLNDVSCSPYRVPVARLAAAHAALKMEEGAERRKAGERRRETGGRRQVKEKKEIGSRGS